jgi:hypothetical protein
MSWIRRLRRIKWHKVVIGIVIGLVLAGGQGLFELHQGASPSWVWGIAVIVTFVGILLTSEVIWKLSTGRQTNEAALMAALKMAVRSCNLGEEANVRTCVYVVLPGSNPRMLFQEFPYVYAYAEKESYALIGGQGLSETVGIVGQVLRMNKESLYTSLDNSDGKAFEALLTAAPWNFTPDQAKRIDKTRPSYMAFPFEIRATHSRKKDIQGVLFFDAIGQNRFTDRMVARFLNEQRDVVVDYVAACF